MAMTIEVKCKGIEAYKLGGVKDIQLESHKVGDDTHWDYIAITIFDTRKYAFESVEYIKVYGGAAEVEDDELQYILKFASKEDFGFEVIRKQLRSLWTAYCIRKDYCCDTLQYDIKLNLVWSRLLDNKTYTDTDWQDEGEVLGFELFDNYMCEEMV